MKAGLFAITLIIFTIIYGCEIKKKKQTESIKDNSILFTVDKKGTKINNNYLLAHKLNTTKDFDRKFDKYQTEILELGELNITSGELILCDIREHKDPPNKYYPDSNPFKIKLKPGKYNVDVILANTIDSGQRTAFIQLKISNKKAIKWILAHKTTDNLNTLKNGDFYGTDTEAATLTLFDRKSGIYFNEKKSNYLNNNEERNEYDFFESLFKYSKYDLNNYTKSSCINVDLGIGLNIVQFCTGYGDGSYPAYWGIDKDNYVCSFVVDFGVLR